MEADVQQFIRKFRLWENSGCLGLFDQYAYEHTMTSKKSRTHAERHSFRVRGHAIAVLDPKYLLASATIPVTLSSGESAGITDEPVDGDMSADNELGRVQFGRGSCRWPPPPPLAVATQRPKHEVPRSQPWEQCGRGLAGWMVVPANFGETDMF
ncbi:hypothetical protein BC629DRAFT_1438811 [Irpex lacteus]|nr:hypothetical protein BC629DRAFT_1438811 [Irpex lacteus]